MDEIAEQPLDLRGVLALLRARKGTIFLATVLVTGAALAASYRQTPLYQAEARILIQPSRTDPTSPYLPAVSVDAESALVASAPVAELVRDDLGLERSIDELLAPLTVRPVREGAVTPIPQTSQVLVLSYTSADPDLARDAADSFADNYIEFRRDQALQSLLAASRDIQSRIDAVLDQLTQLTDDLERARKKEDEALATTLESQSNVLLARLGVLQQRLDDVQPDRTIRLGGAQVIKPASRPGSPVSPDHVRNGLAAVMLGLLIGAGLAFLQDRLDDRFRGRLDVVRVTRAPVLATVPRFRVHKRRPASNLIVATHPFGPASEAYKSLRANIEYIASEKGIKSVLVTSASAKEGKSVTSANLGLALAQTGSRVILVSADLRRPMIDGYFDVKAQEGLATWLARPDHEPSRLLRSFEDSNLLLLPAGPIPHNPAELLSSPRLAELIELIEQACDLVVVDAPPVLPVADVKLLAPRVDATLLVVDAATSGRSAATHTREELDKVGVNVIGVVINAFDPSTSPYYQSYYQYGDYYRSGPADGNGGGTESGRKKIGRRRRSNR